ncbi:MAG TPA: iron ABC transporter permease [Methylomirabilota bacterium]|jgi:iron complex transport system permease protein|nr:iron ABC transporter permease [Methylomirabilota bacterium]
MTGPVSGARLAAILLGLALVVALASLGALFLGSARVPPGDVLAVLAGRVRGVDQVVVLSLRLPRILAALLAGGALAVAGAGFQALSRNPLAEPSVLGVSSGAAFGVIVAQVFGLGGGLVEVLGLAACAFAGALAAGMAVYLIAASAGGLPVHTLLLAGVIISLFFSSAITVLISIIDFDRLGGVVHWLLGNLGPIAPRSLAVFAAAVAIGFWLVVGAARQLNLLALGEESAQQLGVDAEALKRRIFAGAALLTSATVAFVGPIGFVGLIVPQTIRMLLGSDNRVVIPAAMLGGGAFLLLADTVARNVIAPAELSVGVITAFCGTPFFIYLLRARTGQPRL